MKKLLKFWISFWMVFCILLSSKVNATELTNFEEDIEKVFEQVKAKHPNVNYASVSISVRDVNTNNYWGINDQLSSTNEKVGQHGEFVSASVIKFPVSYAVIKLAEKGELDLYGTYTDPASGEKFRPIDKIVTAVTRSVNAAVNTLLRTFTSPVINSELTELGYPNVKMFSEIGGGDPYQSYANNIKRHGNSLGGRMNSFEMASMLNNFYKDYINEVSGTNELYTALKNTIYTDRIPKGINYKYPVLHKTGTIGAPDGVYNDCGMIMVDEKPFILCILTQNQKGQFILPFMRAMAKEVTSYMEKATLTDVVTAPTVEIILNGEPLEFIQTIEVVNDQIAVPFRTFAEYMQMEVLWDGVLNEVTAFNDETEIKMVIGGSTALVNGDVLVIDVAVYKNKGTTMVSLGFIAEVLGLEVQKEENTLYIVHPFSALNHLQ